MKKIGKMVLLGVLLATGISNVTQSWWGGGWGWRRRSILQSWRIRNNSDSPLKVRNDVGNILILQPRSDGFLPRSGSFTLFVKDLDTGQRKSFSTADGVVIFYRDSWGSLRIVTRGRWDAGVGWGFGPFAVGVGLWGRGRWGRGWWGGRRGYGGWWHGRGHRRRRGRRVMHRRGMRRGGMRRGGRRMHRGGRGMGARRGGRGGGRRRR